MNMRNAGMRNSIKSRSKIFSIAMPF